MALQTLTLAAARQLIFAAETKAYQLGSPCNISVVDVTGQLIAYVRFDGDSSVGANLSMDKALNSLAADICITGQPDPDNLCVRRHAVSEALRLPGGVTIKSGDDVVGAIGVSGGSTEADHAIATAALYAYKSALTAGRFLAPVMDAGWFPISHQ